MSQKVQLTEGADVGSVQCSLFTPFTVKQVEVCVVFVIYIEERHKLMNDRLTRNKSVVALSVANVHVMLKRRHHTADLSFLKII